MRVCVPYQIVPYSNQNEWENCVWEAQATATVAPHWECRLTLYSTLIAPTVANDIHEKLISNHKTYSSARALFVVRRCGISSAEMNFSSLITRTR